MNSGSLVQTLLVRSRNQHKPCRRRIVSRSSMTVSPRRRCKPAARISPLPSFLFKAQASSNRTIEADCAKSRQFGRSKQDQIRSAWVAGRTRWPEPVRGPRLKSNAHCDRNNLGVKSSGGRVVITRLEIKAITRLAYLDGETNSSICAQGP